MKRGTLCAPCALHGHRCNAVLWVDEDRPEGELTPMCLPCANGEACVVMKWNGAGRSDSKLGLDVNVFGEVFDGSQPRAAVIHRTPAPAQLA